jgi:hypothetical protein
MYGALVHINKRITSIAFALWVMLRIEQCQQLSAGKPGAKSSVCWYGGRHWIAYGRDSDLLLLCSKTPDQQPGSDTHRLWQTLSVSDPVTAIAWCPKTAEKSRNGLLAVACGCRVLVYSPEGFVQPTWTHRTTVEGGDELVRAVTWLTNQSLVSCGEQLSVWTVKSMRLMKSTRKLVLTKPTWAQDCTARPIMCAHGHRTMFATAGRHDRLVKVRVRGTSFRNALTLHYLPVLPPLSSPRSGMSILPTAKALATGQHSYPILVR